MPQETRSYVLAITGLTVEDWANPDNKARPDAGSREPANCEVLMTMLKRAPNPFIEQLEERVRLVAASPWGVQLAAGFSRSRVLQSYARLLQRFEGVLRERDPSILSSVLRSRGTRAFYQVRIGADTRAGADELCAHLRRAGGACIVLRNKTG
jgi:hypothetical protein